MHNFLDKRNKDVIYKILGIQYCFVIPMSDGPIVWHDWNQNFGTPRSDNRISVTNWEYVLYQSQSVDYHLLHGCGKTFMAVMVNFQFSEFLRNSTLMASGIRQHVKTNPQHGRLLAWSAQEAVCSCESPSPWQHSSEMNRGWKGPYLAGITLWPSGP